MNNTRPCKLVDIETLDLTKFKLEKNKSETLVTEKSTNELELFLEEGSHLKYITFDKGLSYYFLNCFHYAVFLERLNNKVSCT